MTTRHLEYSRSFPVAVERAYSVVLTTPLPTIFSRRHLAIAPIVETIGQEGEWGAAIGQTRTIRLKDNTRMLETLTAIEPPQRFGYTISDVKGTMKPLVSAAAGTWAFEPDATGTRITWSWEVTPARLGRLAMPVFARLWGGSAGKAFDRIGALLAA
jgi:hypothetical protein